MNLVSAAEWLGNIDHSMITYDPESCLHSNDKASVCNACFDICPVSAIQPGKPPILDSKKCQSCLACLTICPVGAYTADDAIPSLFNCATRMSRNSLELLCELNSYANVGVSPESIGIQVKGCLAGLGAGVYMALIAMEFQEIIVRTDTCEACKWQSLRLTIKAQIEKAQKLLKAWEKRNSLSELSNLTTHVERQLWNADNPPLSRRDLFQMFVKHSQIAIARSITAEKHPTERRPGRDYIRIEIAAKHLPDVHLSEDYSLGEIGYSNLTIFDDCTACGTCVRVCPTSALQLEVDEEEEYYRIKFLPLTCVGCEACVHVCVPGAISINHSPSFTEVFERKEDVILSEGDLIRCEKCNTLFASHSGERLCQVCEYRRKNPFGSVLPEELKIHLDQIKNGDADDH